MKIALLCPTKSRPGDLIRLIRSVENTVHKLSNIKLYIGVDSDDDTQREFDNCIRFKSYITKIVFPEYTKFPGLGVLWNYMASQASEDIFAMVGDDFVYETPGWEQIIIDEFKSGEKDNIMMIHCNDGIHGPGNKYPDRYIQSVNPFIHRNYYEINGYYLREEFKHQFLDTWIDTVYKAISRGYYRHDIMIRHLHFSQTRRVDNVTQNLRNASEYDKCKRLFTDLQPERKKEIDRLLSFING